jgi:hypothetical protein
MKPLTEKQDQAVATFRNFTAAYERTPSFNELAVHLDSSPGAAHSLIHGALRKQPLNDIREALIPGARIAIPSVVHGTPSRRAVRFPSMYSDRQFPTMTDALRQTIKDSPNQQKDLAVKIGICPTSLSGFVGGKSGLLSKNVEALCRIFWPQGIVISRPERVTISKPALAVAVPDPPKPAVKPKPVPMVAPAPAPVATASDAMAASARFLAENGQHEAACALYAQIAKGEK